MSSPLSMIMPSVLGLSVVFGCALFLFSLPLLTFFRGLSLSGVLKSWAGLFPRWGVFTGAGVLFLGGSFLAGVGVSLIPFSVVGFHFPMFGVGLSLSLWVLITWAGTGARAFQYKKEYLGDTTLSAWWASMSFFIESMSRAARAITLGARISVNIMMGGILHSVIGEGGASGGMLGLAVLEALVVFIQVYVFILLLCFYTIELV